jgi:hypothetical protein
LAEKFHVISLTEHEFWRREFWAEVSAKDENYLVRVGDLISSGIMPVIQIGPSEQEVLDLKGLPKASVVVQFHADETYLPKINYQIIRNPAVSMILRSYPVPEFKLSKIFSSQRAGLRDLSQNFTIRNFLEYLKLVFAGMAMVKRQVFIAVLERIYSKVSVPMPLGYNDLFAESYCAVNKVEKNSSLIEFAINGFPARNKKTEISFVGQLGKLTRRFAIKAMENISPKELIIRRNYGGAIGIYGATLESGIESVQALMNSKLALCPPGNYSNNTFRIAESLICGAMPMFNQGSITDPICSYSYLSDGILGLPKNWKKKLEVAVGFDQENIDDAIKASLKNLSSEIERVRNKIIEAQPQNNK